MGSSRSRYARNERGSTHILSPGLLTKKATKKFHSASSHIRSTWLFGFCPDSVQYLLRTYLKEQAILEAIENLDNVLEATKEDQNTFPSRVLVPTYRCCNVHTEVESISIFFNGNLPEMLLIISTSRREQLRNMLTFNIIVSNSRDEGILIGLVCLPTLNHLGPQTIRTFWTHTT